MNVNFVQRDKGSWILDVVGEGHTLFNVLKRKLQDDKTIKFAGYSHPHPLMDKFTLSIKGSNVKSSVDKAIQSLKAEISMLEKETR